MHTCGRGETCIQNSGRKSRKDFEVSVNDRVILKWILKKLGGKPWT
jgi:hypothetical protein